MPSPLLRYGKSMSNVIRLVKSHAPFPKSESLQYSAWLIREMRAEIAKSQALLCETKEILRKMPSGTPNFD